MKLFTFGGGACAQHGNHHPGGFRINTDFDSQDMWTLKELQARKLPLHWNEGWLWEQLDLLTSFEAIGQAFSIARFAKKNLGLH